MWIDLCFSFASPYLSDSEHLFFFMYSIICVFFGRMFIQIQGSFFNKICFVLNCWVPYIFWILTPYPKYGLQIHRLPFHFLLQFLVLCNPSYVVLLLLSVLLASYLKQIPKSVFLLGVLQFQVLYLCLSSALTFVCGTKTHYFCMGLIQFSQYKLLKRLYFSTLCIYSSLVED